MELTLKHQRLLQNGCLINGCWSNADNSATFEVVNPSSGRPIARVTKVGREETLRAIAAAQAALPAWRALPGKDRAVRLRRWAELMLEHQDDLACLITSEQGKPLVEAKGEVAYAASYAEWFSEAAKRVNGDVLQSPRSDQRLLVLKQAVGVTAAITPWNFPAAMITRKVAPALAAGCTMIVKPAELTPLTGMALAVLAQEAGIPDGVLQVLAGDAIAIGGALCESDVVRKLSFTGSTAVGRLLMAQCAPTVKKLSLELGGNAPVLIFDDADLDRAVEGIVASKFRNTGQTCVCANRIYVQEGVYDEVALRLALAVSSFKVGDGMTPGVTQGPLINPAAVAKACSHIDDAVSQGARVLVGGRPHALQGNFIEPTVLVDVTQDMRFAQEETFGPVAPLFRFKTEDEAIHMANDTVFGLAAYLFTADHTRVWRVTEALECGMVGVNTGLMSSEVAPFGGVKQSGLGREGSSYGIDEYLELKYVCIDMRPPAAVC